MPQTRSRGHAAEGRISARSWVDRGLGCTYAAAQPWCSKEVTVPEPIKWILVLMAVFSVPIIALVAMGIGSFRTWFRERHNPKPPPAQRSPDWIEPEEWYGENHQDERAKYVDIIREHGGVCMERICIMPSRRIETGARWDLAHDHEAGGRHDYLGPSHPECNKYEAEQRKGHAMGGIAEGYVNGPRSVPLPEGSYEGVVVGADISTHPNDGKTYLEITYQVTAGRFEGRDHVEEFFIAMDVTYDEHGELESYTPCVTDTSVLLPLSRFEGAGITLVSEYSSAALHLMLANRHLLVGSSAAFTVVDDGYEAWDGYVPRLKNVTMRPPEGRTTRKINYEAHGVWRSPQ